MGNTFLQQCEEAANEPYTARGLKGGCLVNLSALRDLIFHFKRINDELRGNANIAEKLRIAEQERDQYKNCIEHLKIECAAPDALNDPTIESVHEIPTGIRDMREEIDQLRAQIKAAQEQEPIYMWRLEKDAAKADAVMEFVGQIAGAYDSGFVDTPVFNIAQLFQVARNHVKDSFGVDTKTLAEEFDEDFARSCNPVASPVAWMHDVPGRYDVISDEAKQILVKALAMANSKGVERAYQLDKSEHYTIPLYKLYPSSLPQNLRLKKWECEAKRAFWAGLEIGASFGSVAIAPRWDEYIAKRKSELAEKPEAIDPGGDHA